MHALTGHAHERKPGATTGSCSIVNADAESDYGHCIILMRLVYTAWMAWIA